MDRARERGRRVSREVAESRWLAPSLAPSEAEHDGALQTETSIIDSMVPLSLLFA